MDYSRLLLTWAAHKICHLTDCKHDSFHKCTVLSPAASLSLCASLRALLQLSSLLVWYHPILHYLAFYWIPFNFQTIFVRLSYCFSSFTDISSTILFTPTYRYHSFNLVLFYRYWSKVRWPSPVNASAQLITIFAYCMVSLCMSDCKLITFEI